MTFRLALARYDTHDNFFFEWKDVGKEKKKIDMAHITPFQLRKFFPKIFASVTDYYKFGFARNPYDRYLSAISQHLKLSTPYLRRAILSEPDLFYRVASSFALTSLEEGSIERDLKLVHFRRQSNFFYLEGRKWVDDIFKLEDLPSLEGSKAAGWLGDAIATPKNQTTEYASGYEIERLSAPAVEALNIFYAQDFERFDYSTI